MSIENVAQVHVSTKEKLRQLGVEDEFELDLLSSRLIVERIGEAENMAWWRSHVLSETGRLRLGEVAPQTQTKTQVNLAQKVGRKVESSLIPTDSLSLFSFGPRIEARLSNSLEAVQTANHEFTEIEKISVTSVDREWTAPLLEQFHSTDQESLGLLGPSSPSESKDALCLSDEDLTQKDVEIHSREILAALLRGYGSVTGSLRVPYIPLAHPLRSSAHE